MRGLDAAYQVIGHFGLHFGQIASITKKHSRQSSRLLSRAKQSRYRGAEEFEPIAEAGRIPPSNRDSDSSRWPGGSEMRTLRNSHILTLILAIMLPGIVAGQQQPVLWPDNDHPILRFTFGKFKDMGGSVGSQRPYAIDTIAENLSTKLVGSEHFIVYVFDKKQIRISDGWMDVTNLNPGQSVKFQMTFMASGTPVSLKLASGAEPSKQITLTVNSSPQGALLSVDGHEVGTTPKLIQVGPGKHQLTFSKGGFRTGVFPLEISANDVSGGTVSYELGTSQFDTIEMRDGTVLTGDLDAVRGMEIVVRVGGTLESIDRNKVKRISLVQREPAQPSDLPPAEAKP